MCGISGINGQFNITDLHASRLALVHRGPDDSGYFAEPDHQIGLTHTRLSILDLSPLGHQPMASPDGKVVLVFNGEIYNFRELRTSLEAKGIHFCGRSDTEVILHAYAQQGLEGLKRLEGIFALTLWDPKLQRLVLMGDRLGVKPHGDRTFYKGVRALEPGHQLIIEHGRRRLEPWWCLEKWLAQPLAARHAQEAAEQVRAALDRAVARQLIADVPVGLFISGGVDSSSIAAATMQLRGQPLHSYAAGFDFDHGVNELPKAARVAQHLGLIHHELHVKGSELESVLLALAQAHDEPFADAANIPLYLMCHQLQGQIKVVLQGDGGDELFAGYRCYAMLRNAHQWQLWPRMFSPIARTTGRWGQRFVRMAESVGHTDPALRMAYLLTLETTQRPPESVFLPEQQQHLVDSTDPFLAYRQAAERFRGYDPVQQMLLTDLTVQLPSQFLTKVDRATMVVGVEARVPLLDEEVVRLVVAIPSEWKVNGVEKKVVLRHSQRGRLPDDILDGPKTGFGVPYEYWLRTSLYEFACSQILEPSFVQRFGLDIPAMERLIQHQQGRSERGFRVWKLL